MRKIALLFILLAFSLSEGWCSVEDTVKVNEYYFCVTPGTRLEFVRTLSNGKVKWTNIMTIHKVEHDGCQGRIEYTSMMLDGRNRPKYRQPVPMEVSLVEDGVMMDMGKNVSGMLAEMLPRFMTKKMRHEGGMTFFPSHMEAGDTLADMNCVITIMGIDGTVRIDERRVLGFETLKTDVGEFECVKISEHKVERGAPRNRETVGITWYAKGMGILRHDTYDMEGKRMSVEVISKIEKIDDGK